MATPQTRAPTIIASQSQSQVISQQQQQQQQKHQIANTNTLLQLQQHQLQKQMLSTTNASPTAAAAAHNLCNPIGNQSFSNNKTHSNNFKITNGDSNVDNQNHPNSIGGQFKIYSESTNQLVINTKYVDLCFYYILFPNRQF